MRIKILFCSWLLAIGGLAALPASAGQEVNCATDLDGCDGLVSYWKLDEATGNLIDSHGSNNGTAYGGLGYGQDGVVNDAMFFDGGSDYADCGNDASLQMTTAITLEAWVKPNSNGNGDFDYIASKLVHASNREGYALGLWTDNTVAFIVGQSWSNWSMAQSTEALQAGQWYHVVGTYDGTDIKVYINGEEDGTQNYTGGIWDSQTPFLIGKRSDGSPYDGTIDELRIWDEALGPDDVKTAYNIGAQPVTDATEYTVTNGSTDFEAVSDMASVNDMILANTFGSITWDNANARLQDADTHVVIGEGFVSVDSAELDGSWNSSATVSIPIGDCNGYIAYYASGTHNDLESIKTNGQVCNEGTTPACTNFSCTDSTLSFDVTEFSGYGAEGGGVHSNPEYSTATLFMALFGGLGALWFVRKNRKGIAA